MNLLFSVMLLFLFHQNLDYVSITGQIVKHNTNEPVSYFKIGLVATTVGTVSDDILVEAEQYEGCVEVNPELCISV